MYAVVTTGGKQVRVKAGDVIRVEKVDGDVGSTIELGPVSLVAKDDGLIVGLDRLTGAKVVAQVMNHGQRKKIRVFKYKKRKQYHRTFGHRQQYSEIKITDIQA